MKRNCIVLTVLSILLINFISRAEDSEKWNKKAIAKHASLVVDFSRCGCQQDPLTSNNQNINQNNLIKQINNIDEFNKAIIASKLPVIVKFYSPTCGACQRMNSVLKEITREYRNKIEFFEINITTAPDISNKYNIKSVPTLLFLNSNKEQGRLIGLSQAGVIKKKIEEYLQVK